MPRMEREYKLRTLECDTGHQFKAQISHMRPVSDEGSDPLNWTAEEGDIYDMTCPVCGSDVVELRN